MKAAQRSELIGRVACREPEGRTDGARAAAAATVGRWGALKDRRGRLKGEAEYVLLPAAAALYCVPSCESVTAIKISPAQVTSLHHPCPCARICMEPSAMDMEREDEGKAGFHFLTLRSRSTRLMNAGTQGRIYSPAAEASIEI